MLLACGGFVPVLSAWLRDEISDRGGLIEALGGVHVVTETRDPDADLGPVLAYTDAPLLFSAVNEVARRLGVKSPDQIRLTYLPCCGVVAWDRSQALILGLPLLRVLNLAELRAILAHELAHLARGDATRAARSARFVEGLRQALEQAGGRERGPLGAWARTCFLAASRLIGPIARGQEARADRSAAAIAGGTAAASALIKVATVQPLFREVLEHYDPTNPETPNLYAFFRAFWYRLPPEVHTDLRLGIFAASDSTSDPAHPPLPDRLAQLQAYPRPRDSASRRRCQPRHRLPRRPRRFRADAPQPPLRPAHHRTQRFSPRAGLNHPDPQIPRRAGAFVGIYNARWMTRVNVAYTSSMGRTGSMT